MLLPSNLEIDVRSAIRKREDMDGRVSGIGLFQSQSALSQCLTRILIEAELDVAHSVDLGDNQIGRRELHRRESQWSRLRTNWQEWPNSGIFAEPDYSLPLNSRLLRCAAPRLKTERLKQETVGPVALPKAA